MRSYILLTALAVCATASWGQAIDLHLDPAHTTIQFTLSATLHTVHGSFKLKHGDIHFDPATGRISGEVVVDATTGNSGDDGRDRRMHKDVLQSAKYPEIVFTPDRVNGAVAQQGASQIQVHGMFRIHGDAHEITLPVDVHIANGQVSAKTHFTIPYVKWGMKNPSNFFLHVGDKVEIGADASAVP
ncbi:MAG TPA: YceI family protein [Bryobacteraceae bacterium]|nr:YceI family protein [Bryobacteraceae bacterium]